MTVREFIDQMMDMPVWQAAILFFIFSCLSAYAKGFGEGAAEARRKRRASTATNSPGA